MSYVYIVLIIVFIFILLAVAKIEDGEDMQKEEDE